MEWIRVKTYTSHHVKQAVHAFTRFPYSTMNIYEVYVPSLDASGLPRYGKVVFLVHLLDYERCARPLLLFCLL